MTVDATMTPNAEYGRGPRSRHQALDGDGAGGAGPSRRSRKSERFA
jgi:hypothetical protein